MGEERPEITCAYSVAILAGLGALFLLTLGCLFEVRAFQIRRLEILIFGATLIGAGIVMTVISVAIWIKTRG